MSQSSPYYFVSPSDPDGDRFAYSKTGAGHPAPVFIQAAWEWLLERAVRRLVVLQLVGAEHVSLNLSERAGMYRVPRLLCMPFSSGAESAFRSADRTSYLPRLGYDDYADERTAFGPPAVPGLVAELLSLGGADGDPAAYPGFWFCDPGSWPAERSVDASYYEESEVVEPSHGTSVEAEYESRTAVRSRPYSVSGILPVFRPLGDMRVDESDERPVPVWDPEAGEFVERRMRCPRTRFPRSFDADPDHGELESVEVGHDWYVPESGRESVDVLVLHGLTRLSREFAVECRVNADLGAYEGSYPLLYSRQDSGDAESPCLRDSMRSYVGALSSAPSPSRTGLAFASARASYLGTVHPAPDWDGKASCWEAWGLPDLGAVPAGTAYRRQLEAACSARPCIPPAAPPLPAADDPDGAQYSREYPVAPPESPARPPCSAAPVNAGLVLDRLLVTVHPVERLYAKVEVRAALERTESGSELREGTGESTLRGTWREESRNELSMAGTFVGSPSALFDLGGGYFGLPVGDPDGENSFSHVDDSVSEDFRTDPVDWDHDRTEHRGVERTSASASAVGLVALRDGAGVRGIATSESSRTERRASGNYYGDDPPAYDVAGESPSGEDSRYVPEDSDLLFHPDVMAWMKRAELFAVVRVSAVAEGGESSSSTLTETSSLDSGSGWNTTSVRESSAGGRRTSRGRYRVVSLGRMDLETGEFPDLDLAGLVADSLPHGGGTGFSHPDVSGVQSPWTYSSESLHESSYSDSGISSVTRNAYSVPERMSTNVDLCRAYVAVEWRFDSDDPPAPSPAGGGVARRVTAARASLSSARSAFGRASAGLAAARSRLDGLSSRLDALAGVVSGGVPAREDAVEDARAALARAREAREAAAAAVESAAADVAEAEAAVPSGDAGPAELDAALSAVSAARRALREAKSDLVDAETEEGAREAELADMEAGAAVDQAAAEAALSDAEGAYSDAEGEYSDADGAKPAAEAAVSDAEDALSEALHAQGDVQSAAAAAESAAAAVEAAGEFADAVGVAEDAAAGAESAYARAFAAAWGV